MNQEKSTALTTIARKIEELLLVEQDGSSASRWKRGLLYKEARELFPSNQEFGNWCNRTNAEGEGSCDIARIDDSATINRLMRCVEYLDEDQFFNLKYSRAVEVVPRWLWEVNQDDVIANELTYGMTTDEITSSNAALIQKIHDERWSVKECRLYMKKLKDERQKVFNESRDAEQKPETPPDELDLVIVKDNEIERLKEQNKRLAERLKEVEEENQKLKESLERMITEKVNQSGISEEA